MPTIVDVAKQSGFSIATVSNVLSNGPKPVRAETRRIVLDAARRLNFHPNATAQGLVRRRTKCIGLYFYVVEAVIVTTDPYAAGILSGILQATATRGYNLTFFTQLWRSAAESAASFRDGRADGLIVVAPSTSIDILPALSDLGLQVVSISGAPPTDRIPFVDVDDYAGTRLAVDHLLSLGHRRIAHITGDLNTTSAQRRKDAFLERTADLRAGGGTVSVAEGSFDGLGARRTARMLLCGDNRPTAIFAANDSIAGEVVAAAESAGLAVPRDLSVVGYDDFPLAALARPPLTTIKQPVVEIGRTAVEVLLELLSGDEASARTVLLSPELVVRGSTGGVPNLDE